MATKQIYQFKNKPILSNTDLFVISDEETVDHELVNSRADQAIDYISSRTMGSYTPTFSNASNITVSSNNAIYNAYKPFTGNWVQVTLFYTVTYPNTTNTSFRATIPFGGNFTNVNDAIFVGASSLHNASGTGNTPANGTIFQYISANVGTNQVTIASRTSQSPNISVQVSCSFLYLLR